MNVSLSVFARRAGVALCLLFSTLSQAGLALEPGDPQTVQQYLRQAKASQQAANLLGESEEDGVKVLSYGFVSQRWPGQGSTLSSDAPQWEHELKLALPSGRKPGSPVLLYISGGINHAEKGPQPPRDALPLAELARGLGIAVAELYYTPNQNLQLDGRAAGREDALVAYSWRKSVDQPEADRFSSLHLPMTQATVAAMDVIQAGLPDARAFVLSGSSKRGWTSWLAGLNDQRVQAIVPVVADFWNVRANFAHVYNSYGKQWPLALRDYAKNRLTDDVLKGGPGLDALLRFEDVVNYPDSMSRLQKYMVSAAGDDFAVPDSGWSYLPAMKGPMQLRYLPNQSHYVGRAQVSEALRQFMGRWLAGKPLPEASVQGDEGNGRISVSTREPVVRAKLWLARNPDSRDFRFRSGIRYQEQPIEGQCQQGECRFEFTPDASQPGWQAYFIEFEGKDFTWTTPPLIWPKRYPDGSSVPFGAPRLQLGG
ncbi:PhoPQ-activated protein PqaA family protein [Chromobacterium sp. IIBBL 290-4]|uniref:PhoPQ-activated protein PqaA family protein n=1 Tax=Chromobacterium sp. IIBBL 290-4 TaxID=2953890 RepID=UPI0020B83D1D|nr:PhoPQ-activated protein PqaA family protein [Chromobacterium sp. IIBBL 290-4]UTH73086.1 PhoPQ-activated pathogenicity-related family protein [Chromobacterium sp. IIBBL 290-4]